jgi:hypothetical protein
MHDAPRLRRAIQEGAVLGACAPALGSAADLAAGAGDATGKAPGVGKQT